MSGRHKIWIFWLLGALGVFLGVRFLLPVLLPFLLGGAVALGAEPLVRFFCDRCRIPRPAAAGIGVSMAVCFVGLMLLMLGALLVREMGLLAGVIPDLEQTAAEGMATLSGWLERLAERAPGGLSGYLTGNIRSFFSGGTALLDRVSEYLLGLAGGFLSHVPSGALSITTGLIASYMISAKLPRLKQLLRQYGSANIAPAWRRIKAALGGWFLAQAKLSAVTFAIVTLGFWLLRVRHAPVWAILVASVDALPVLGTGTVLVPWSVVCFLRGSTARGIGILGLYVLVVLTRSILEPRLVGKHLGLDPLITLGAFYAGYRLWGIGGMILAPMLAAAVFQMLRLGPEQA